MIAFKSSFDDAKTSLQPDVLVFRKNPHDDFWGKFCATWGISTKQVFKVFNLRQISYSSKPTETKFATYEFPTIYFKEEEFELWNTK